MKFDPSKIGPLKNRLNYPLPIINKIYEIMKHKRKVYLHCIPFLSSTPKNIPITPPPFLNTTLTFCVNEGVTQIHHSMNERDKK